MKTFSITSENQNTVGRLNLYKNLYTSKGFLQDQAVALANSSIVQNLAQQSQLLTNRAIFMIFGGGLLLVTLLIIIIPPIHNKLAFKIRLNKLKNIH